MDRSLQGATAALLIGTSILVLLISNAVAQEQKVPALPTPEMQRLSKLYLGTWSYTEKYPNGGVNTGVYTSELGPGGNSIVNRFHSKGPMGEFDGLMVMTWDSNEKAYKAYVFSGASATALVETGQWEGDVLVYRAELSAGARKFALRNATKFLDGKITSDQFSSANGSPESLLVHVEAFKN